jgi:hypothetical protein
MPGQIVPLTSAQNQTLTVSLSINGGTVSLQLSVSYNAMGGFWQMNIADQTDTPIVGPVPLLTGAYPAGNILAAYQYMNIGSAFVINVSGIVNTVNGVPVDWPQTNLGTDYVLLWDDNTNYVPGQPFGGVLDILIPGPPGPQGPPGVVGGLYFMGTVGNLTPQPGDTQFTSQAGSQAMPLTGPVTILAPNPSVPGAIFAVQIVQPPSGGKVVTWASFYKGVSIWPVDTTGNTQATFWFQINSNGTAANLFGTPQNGNPIS